MEMTANSDIAPSGAPPWISVIIPAYNAAPVIKRSLEIVRRFLGERSGSWGEPEIIVVDDCSTDETASIVESEFSEVRLIRHPRNYGKGRAVRTGMRAATGTYRFFIDADVPFDLNVLDTMVHYLDVKEFDICVGTRTNDPNLHYAHRSLLRRFTSSIFTAVVSRIVVTGIRDTQCGLKGFRSDVARYLFSESRIDGFAFDVEILYLAFKNDLDIKRIPVTLVSDDYSSVSVFRDGFRMLLSIVQIPIRYYLRRYAMMSDRSNSCGG